MIPNISIPLKLTDCIWGICQAENRYSNKNGKIRALV